MKALPVELTYSNLFFGLVDSTRLQVQAGCWDDGLQTTLTIFTVPNHLIEAFWLDASPKLVHQLEIGKSAALEWDGLAALQLLTETIDATFAGPLDCKVEIGPSTPIAQGEAVSIAGGWLNFDESPHFVAVAPRQEDWRARVRIDPGEGCVWIGNFDATIADATLSGSGLRLRLAVR